MGIPSPQMLENIFQIVSLSNFVDIPFFHGIVSFENIKIIACYEKIFILKKRKTKIPLLREEMECSGETKNKNRIGKIPATTRKEIL